MADNSDPNSNADSLEGNGPDYTLNTGPSNFAPPTPSNKSFLKTILNWRFIVIILIIIVLLAGGILAFVSKKPSKVTKTVVINTQNLNNGTLNKITSQLNGTTAPSTQLTISPNTIFKNNVTVQGKETIGSDLDVGGNLSVHGSGSIGSNLSVHGSGSIGANLSVAGLITASSLSVGSLSINTISLSGDINVGGHIIPTGAAPSVTASTAASGGNANISGNDTSGTVNINIGNGRLLAGELAIITFHKPFGTNPDVQLTPVNAASAQIDYYVTESPTFFTIDCVSTPSTNANYTFNYSVTQ